MSIVEIIDYSILSPGIRDLVQELREVHNLETTDSGDGTNFSNGMENALKERHVFITIEKENMIGVTQLLSDHYPHARVECSWSPGQTAIIMIFPDGLVLPPGVSKVKQ